jgi:PKD repeat protein
MPSFRRERAARAARPAVELLEDRTLPGLVAAYNFNEAGGTTVLDGTWHEGNGSPGTISGATRTTQGKYGGALSFDGIDDWVTIPDSLYFDLTTGMTVEAWVKPAAIDGWETVLMKESGSGYGYGLYADNNGDDLGQPRRPAAWVVQNSSYYGAEGAGQLPAGAWTHLAATYDGAALRLYVNGAQAGVVGQSGSIDVTSGPLRIGGNALWGEYFSGLIDEVRVYNNALTAAQIQTDMATPINKPPVALAMASPTSGPPGMTVNFDGHYSGDEDGDPLTYAWDLDADGQYDDSTSVTPSFTYPTAGRYPVKLRVTDSLGASGTSTVVITVGNPPTAVIDTPSPGLTWKVGDVITFSGHADDAEDGSLPPAALSWSVDLHTGPNSRTVYSFSGVSSGSFSAPDTTYPAYLELTFIARDSGGATDRKSIFRYPQTVNLRIESSPSGLQVAFNDMTNANGTPPATPFMATAIIGSTNTINAVSPQTLGGTPYDFASWSDGGAASHTITAPAANATYTATYTPGQAPSGLVAAFGFNETTGTTAADGSGTGNAGTVSGATWTTGGKYGGALSFDGVNDWVTVADSNSLDLTTGMTVEAWVKPATINGWETVLMKESSSSYGYGLYADNNGNDVGQTRRPAAWIVQSGNYFGAEGTSQLSTNTWTHLAATYDGSTLRLYVNGTQASSVSRSGSIDTTSGALRIGGNNIWGEWFNGLIDEVRVYNRALSATEIQGDMSTPVGSPERLIGEAVAAGDAPPLSRQELRPLFDEAVRRWSAALGDAEAVERLRAVRVEILDIPGTILGLVSSTVIYVDADGAGHGWFLDPTPADDCEFAPGVPDSPAAGRVDLLTVMTHELGHILGLDDDSRADPFTGTVMADVLPLGVRRIHLENLVSAVALLSAPPIVSDTAPRFAGASACSQTFAAPARLPVRIASSPAASLDPAFDNPIWFLAPTPAVESSTAGNEKQKRTDPPTVNALEQIFKGVFEIIIHATQGNDDATSSSAFGIPSPPLAEPVP